MKKHISDKKTGISYTRNRDYHILGLVSQKQEYEIGRFGREHLQYLKKNKPTIYTEFFFLDGSIPTCTRLTLKHWRCMIN